MIHTQPSELAATLSFWVPGLGQLYAASWKRGIAIALASGVSTRQAWAEISPGAVWAGRWPENPPSACLWWGVVLAIWLWNIPDAAHTMSSRSANREAKP